MAGISTIPSSDDDMQRVQTTVRTVDDRSEDVIDFNGLNDKPSSFLAVDTHPSQRHNHESQLPPSMFWRRVSELVQYTLTRYSHRSSSQRRHYRRRSKQSIPDNGATNNDSRHATDSKTTTGMIKSSLPLMHEYQPANSNDPMYPPLHHTLSHRPQLTTSNTVVLTKNGVNTISSHGNKNNVSTSSSKCTFLCRLCLMENDISESISLDLSCGHMFCEGCLRTMITLAISEARIFIECPLPECDQQLHPTDISRIVGSDDEIMAKYERFMVRRVLQTIPDCRWCPAPDCSFAVIASGCASCPKLVCHMPGCNTAFCYNCKQIWHPNQTCKDAATEMLTTMNIDVPANIAVFDGRKRRRQRLRYRTFKDRSPSELMICDRSVFSTEFYEKMTVGTVKRCPYCKVAIMKVDDGSCNHMTCSQCGTQFCWLCLKISTDLHFLRPSGCTFWGRKRWSRKKKILWHCLALIGAPFGITVAACVSIPAIVIGLPVWAGRKAYRKMEAHKKHKRNVAVLMATVSALLAAPVLASVTVVVGVPALLTYTYGVIPMSMCLSDNYPDHQQQFEESMAEIRKRSKVSDDNDRQNISISSSIEDGMALAERSRKHQRKATTRRDHLDTSSDRVDSNTNIHLTSETTATSNRGLFSGFFSRHTPVAMNATNQTHGDYRRRRNRRVAKLHDSGMDRGQTILIAKTVKAGDHESMRGLTGSVRDAAFPRTMPELRFHHSCQTDIGNSMSDRMARAPHRFEVSSFVGRLDDSGVQLADMDVKHKLNARPPYDTIVVRTSASIKSRHASATTSSSDCSTTDDANVTIRKSVA